MILEPNRRRRRRVVRAVVGAGALLLAVSAIASGWTLPALSSLIPTASPGIVPTPSAAVALVPTPSPEVTATPTPAPTVMANGCLPPPTDLAPATVLSHGSRSAKLVALTFDDGYNADNVIRILRFLTTHRVNATFFPTGQAIEMAPITWLRVAQAGYPLANHTYHHTSLAGKCFADQLAELRRAEGQFQEEALPLQGFMRPPYEEFDLNTRLAASAAGESHVVLWDVDTLDWTGLGKQAIAGRALDGKSGSIILMHTTSRSTTAALDEIVTKYRARGYAFVTIGQVLGIPGPVPFP